jgi:endoglucanase
MVVKPYFNKLYFSGFNHRVVFLPVLPFWLFEPKRWLYLRRIIMFTLIRRYLFLILLAAYSVPSLAFYVNSGKIYTQANVRVPIRGVNWFGFETPDHVVHGLWVRPWKSMITQMKTLGFNAVRIPVCPASLYGATVSSIDYAKNPDLVGKNSLQILDLVMNEFNKQGFFILLDHHRPDCNAISELWTTSGYTESNWINDLVYMANRYKKLPRFLGIDLKNEPHGIATWGAGSLTTDWNKAAERAASAVLTANPNLLVFVEGIGESTSCSGQLGHWWGGNLEPLKCTPLAIPANKLVLSPHVYGPDVYNQPYFNRATFPGNLPAIWNAHFGQFAAAGYAVVIGEFGGKYGHGGNVKDKAWQDALVKYLLRKNITNSFYWSWNPNSGDTGGVLQDDWTTPWHDKVDLLLTLWRKKSVCSDGLDNDGDGLIDYPADPGCLSVLDADETNAVTVVAACADKIDNDNDGFIDYPMDIGCSSATDNDEVNVASGVQVSSVDITSDWLTGYCATVHVQNQGTVSEIWKVNFTVQGTIYQMWNATYTQSGTGIVAQGETWNNVIPAGGRIDDIGFCANR